MAPSSTLTILTTKEELGARAAAEGASVLRAAVARAGAATSILATGASQFEMLEYLVQEEVEWGKVTAFHLDEYIGLSMDHPASFRRYLKERFVDRLPQPLKAFHYIEAEREPEAVCQRLSALIDATSVAVAFIGIGENGHLAFNDPPADFDTAVPYLVVDLDEACRRQQVGEGWFESLEAVPRQAISMSVQQIMKARTLICCVPDARKAVAVHAALEGPVTPLVPASILQQHPACHFFLDPPAAARLTDSLSRSVKL